MKGMGSGLPGLLRGAIILLLLGCAALQAREADRDMLPGVTVSQLPSEARTTLRLIERGGPFPYRRDGSVFGNRERLLPIQPHGYYREYTVRTPASPDRGARRIVAGERGERYYTADHYRSFRRIIR